MKLIPSEWSANLILVNSKLLLKRNAADVNNAPQCRVQEKACRVRVIAGVERLGNYCQRIYANRYEND